MSAEQEVSMVIPEEREVSILEERKDGEENVLSSFTIISDFDTKLVADLDDEV